MEPFIVIRKKPEYTQVGSNPKISIDKATYIKLSEIAAQSNQSISQIAIKAIEYASKFLKYVDEE